MQRCHTKDCKRTMRYKICVLVLIENAHDLTLQIEIQQVNLGPAEGAYGPRQSRQKPLKFEKSDWSQHVAFIPESSFFSKFPPAGLYEFSAIFLRTDFETKWFNRARNTEQNYVLVFLCFLI